MKKRQPHPHQKENSGKKETIGTRVVVTAKVKLLEAKKKSGEKKKRKNTRRPGPPPTGERGGKRGGQSERDRRETVNIKVEAWDEERRGEKKPGG